MNTNTKEKNLIAAFTIVELLIVIAIIGVLAAIVLVNVTRYINKGKDAAAKGDMATLLTQAITYYNENGSFDGVTNDPDYKKTVEGLQSEKMGYSVIIQCNDTGGNCAGGASEWCASILLKSTSNYYCVDSTGAKKETSSGCEYGKCPD